MAEKHVLDNNFGVILLAAGQSSRLGQPKQLLSFAGNTLLKHTFQIAKASAAHKVVVVLGANAETIQKEIGAADINLVLNKNWHEGMASSIRYGLEALVEIDPNVNGVILMVCDQPHVTSALLNNIIMAHHKTKKPIIACSYENTYGSPVFFHRSMFYELLQLKGDVGARGLIKQHIDEVEIISFPKGDIDIDTQADYEKLQT